MKCPIDNETLVMTERNGVEIDYCPQCRGVWLDRGELDKIIERSSSDGNSKPHYDTKQNYREHKNDYYKSKRKKRESFLSELFDF